MRLLIKVLSLAMLLMLQVTAQADVLNEDTGFESPDSDPGSGTLGWDDFGESWRFISPEEPYDEKLDVYLRRGADARWGARYVELEVIGAAGEINSRLVRQKADDVPDNQNLHLRMNLKKVGTVPVSGTIRIKVSNTSGVGSPFEDVVDYVDLDDDWGEFTFWPINVPDGATSEVDVTVSIIFSTAGDAQSFSILMDDVTLESPAAADGSFTEHLSFEPIDPLAPILGLHDFDSEFLYNSATRPHEWDITGSSFFLISENLKIETDGGSDGIQYVRAVSPGAGNNPDHRYVMALRSDPADYHIDTVSRFAISMDVRYSGDTPEFGERKIDLKITDQPSCNGANLIGRKRVRFESLTDEFQKFGFGLVKFPTSTGSAPPTWADLEDPYCVRIVTELTNSVTSHIEIDNVQFDPIAPIEMYPGSEVLLLDAEIDPGLPTYKRSRIVPTTFYTDSLPPNPLEKKSLRIHANSQYRFYLPEGITMLSIGGYTGSDPATWVKAEDGGIGQGNGRPYYSVEDTGEDHVFDGETYHLWVLRPEQVKWLKTDLQFYLESTMPAGTSAHIYYETMWDVDPEGDHLDWDPNPVTTPWNTGQSSHVRRVEVQTRTFPTVERPEHLATSIGWIDLGDMIVWPDFLESYGTFGFSHISGHQDNFYEKNPGTATSQTELDFYAAAATAGFGNYAISSPFAYQGQPAGVSIQESDPERKQIHTETSGLTIGCPAYALPLIDESDYCPPADQFPNGDCGEDDGAFNDVRVDALGEWVASTSPTHLQMDVESFGSGAAVAIAGDCARCNDYLDNFRDMINDQSATMEEALKQMGADRAVSVLNAILLHNGNDHDKVPQMGFYHTAGDGVIEGGFQESNGEGVGDQTYIKVFNNKVVNDALLAAGSTLETPAAGHFPFYEGRPSIIGLDFEAIRENADANGLEFFPILNPSERNTARPPAWLYDRVLETLGRGARGLEFFPYEQFEGADFYYYAKAMEAVVAVEHVLVDSIPVANVTVDIPDGETTSDLEDMHGMDASVVRRNNEYVILVSSYGAAGAPISPIIDQDPPWSGPVTVSFPVPDPIVGLPIRLPDELAGSSSTDGSTIELTLDFEPGADGAHTALYYLCTSAAGATDCADGDSDAIPDGNDNCPSISNYDQADEDNDGIGDPCDDVPGSLCDEVDVYEYWNPTVVNHMILTTNVPGFWGYGNQGAVGKVCQTQIPGTYPLHRYSAGGIWSDTLYHLIFFENGIGPFIFSDILGYIFTEEDPKLNVEFAPMHQYYKGGTAIDHWVNTIDPNTGVPGYNFDYTIGFMLEE